MKTRKPLLDSKSETFKEEMKNIGFDVEFFEKPLTLFLEHATDTSGAWSGGDDSMENLPDTTLDKIDEILNEKGADGALVLQTNFRYRGSRYSGFRDYDLYLTLAPYRLSPVSKEPFKAEEGYRVCPHCSGFSFCECGDCRTYDRGNKPVKGMCKICKGLGQIPLSDKKQ